MMSECDDGIFDAIEEMQEKVEELTKNIDCVLDYAGAVDNRERERHDGYLCNDQSSFGEQISITQGLPDRLDALDGNLSDLSQEETPSWEQLRKHEATFDEIKDEFDNAFSSSDIAYAKELNSDDDLF
jgi:frataxin-like iron-binding protein CyaY